MHGVSVSTLAFLCVHWANSSRGAAEWPGALGGQGEGSSLGDWNAIAQTSVRQAHKAVTTWLPLCTEPLSSAIPTLANTSSSTTIVLPSVCPMLHPPHTHTLLLHSILQNFLTEAHVVLLVHGDLPDQEVALGLVYSEDPEEVTVDPGVSHTIPPRPLLISLPVFLLPPGTDNRCFSQACYSKCSLNPHSFI